MATYIKPEAIKDSSLPIEKIDNVALDLADKVNALDDNGKNTFLNKIGLGKIGVISQKQNWTSDYSSYTISDVVRGIIPQYIIEHWKSLSTIYKRYDGNVEFSFNEETGYFECNDLVDITLQDAINIILYGDAENYDKKAVARPARVVFCANLNAGFGATKYIGANEYTERVYCQGILIINRCYLMNFDGYDMIQCQRLKSVSYLKLENVKNFYFRWAFALVTFFGILLKGSLNFQDSKLLSNESILFLIEHEAATSPITITLHPDAYARAMADADILAALETHTNVSLASA